MSLNYHLEGIKNYREVCWPGDKMNPVTEALVFLCMFVGVPQITEKTLVEFATRATLYELANGPMLRRNDNTPRSITLDDIKAHVGLRTNASPITRPVFLKRMVWGPYEEDIKARSQ